MNVSLQHTGSMVSVFRPTSIGLAYSRVAEFVGDVVWHVQDASRHGGKHEQKPWQQLYTRQSRYNNVRHHRDRWVTIHQLDLKRFLRRYLSHCIVFWNLDPGTGSQWPPTLFFLLLVLVLLLSDLRSAKAFSFQNQSSSNFAYTYMWQHYPRSHRDGFPS